MKEITNYCIGNFGFKIDRKVESLENIRNAIGNMTLQEYHSHNANMAYHSLCTTKPPPNNHALLLGLGGKFCIQTRRISYRKLKETLERFKCDVRVKNCVFNNIGISDEPPPKLYFKAKPNNIPKAPPVIKGAVSRFEKAILAS